MDVLRFFNFGDSIINFIGTCCTNRKAVIMLDNGTCSNVIQLERGDAQGDSPSPFLFNLTLQILLFKLELETQILAAPIEVEVML